MTAAAQLKVSGVFMQNLAVCLKCGAVFFVELDDCPYCCSGQFVEVEQHRLDGQVVQPHPPIPARRGTPAWQACMQQQLQEVAE